MLVVRAVTMRRPSGENTRAADVGVAGEYRELPGRAASQMRAVRSLEAVTIRRPSARMRRCGLIAMAVDSTSCAPLAASQMRATPSLEAVTMRWPSGEYTALRSESPWSGHTADQCMRLAVSQIRAVGRRCRR